eukprot:scaffold210465_cov37-Tisochrysis_lutea.AAC.2
MVSCACWGETPYVLLPYTVVSSLLIVALLMRTFWKHIITTGEINAYGQEEAEGTVWWRSKKVHFAEKLASVWRQTAISCLALGLILLLPMLIPMGIAIAVCPAYEVRAPDLSDWGSPLFYPCLIGFALFCNLLIIGAAKSITMLTDRRSKRLNERLVSIEKGKCYHDGAMHECNLAEVLSTGTIMLISVEWLLRQQADFRLARRQELEAEYPDAFVQCDEAAALLDDGKVAALSYRWLSAEHPDPGGWHIGALRSFLASQPGRWKAVMVDFASLPQKDTAGHRTDIERAVFGAGLKSMSALYASPRVSVIQHKAMPNDGIERIPYELSGWCTFEESVASLATSAGGNLYDVYKGRRVLWPISNSELRKKAAWFRSDRKVHFHGASDRKEVADMYLNLVDRVQSLDTHRDRSNSIALHSGTYWRWLRIRQSMFTLCICVAITVMCEIVMLGFEPFSFTAFFTWSFKIMSYALFFFAPVIMLTRSQIMAIEVVALLRGQRRRYRFNVLRSICFGEPILLPQRTVEPEPPSTEHAPCHGGAHSE